MGDEYRVSEPDLIAVVKHSINGGWRVHGRRSAPVLVIRAPTRLHHRHIALHHEILRAGQGLDSRTASVVVPMRVTDEQDPDVRELEAELLDTRTNLRDARFEVGIDEDVACGRGDEVTREPAAADIIKVVGNAERRELLRPVDGVLRARG